MAASLIALALVGIPAPVVNVQLDLGRRGHAVSKDLYGIFFEEINHAGDGGVFAELLENPGFLNGKDGEPAPHWRVDRGTARLDPGQRLNTGRTRSLRFDGAVSNTGFWGVPLRKGASYRLQVWVKGTGTLKAGLGESAAPVGRLGSEWVRIERVLRAQGDDPKGVLRFEVEGGEAWIGFASLKPLDTWGGQPIRRDLGDLIAGLRPAFFRFPGGCFVEGQDFERMWDWKASIGPREARPGKDWRFWGYACTDGLGFHEYLEWSERMGADALFVANCGMSHSQVAPMSQMGRFVQDALDAIEYAIGPVDSKWGALRAKNGHPKPFPLRYVQIGNENGGPEYDERYALMADAIQAKYPQIELIACVWGGVPKSRKLHIIDEHYYSNPAFFWLQKDRYDAYDRSGPIVYVGEYAVTQNAGTGNLAAALGEAAFMTGMERNSDIVKMASYAPLLSNVNRKQWNPNAIVFDNHRSYGTPSYWVQRMFAENRPDRIVPLQFSLPPADARVEGQIGVQTWRTKAEFRDLEVEVDGKKQSLAGWKAGRGSWKVEGGTATQSDMGQDLRAMADGIAFKRPERFEIRLKARKLDGDEGFIVMFGVGGPVPMQWNLGGWGNQTHAFQQGGGPPLPGSVPGRIEPNRWYDLRIVGDRDTVTGYLDGVRVQQTKVEPVPDFAAVAGLDEKKGELVVKIVNGAETPRSVRLGMRRGETALSGRAQVMSGLSLDAENSLDKPRAVAPRWQTFRLGPAGEYSAPARSVNILRLKVQ